MPELPEVETIRQDLRSKIVGKKITKVSVTSKARTTPGKAAFIKALKNNKITKTDRIGKLLIFVLNNKKYLLVHLKLTGQLVYEKGRSIVAGGHPQPPLEKEPNKFTRLTIEFSDGGKLFFNDMRRFGYMKVVDKKNLEKIKKEFGIEPLKKDFTFTNFKKTLGKRKTSIKAALMNQKLFSGIGNIYADESCFAAGIKPSRKVSSLSLSEIAKLYKSIEKVIKKAVEKRGTSFNDYVDADGNKGYFASFLKVYGRGGEKCKKCGEILNKTKMGGRGTVFCPHCQK